MSNLDEAKKLVVKRAAGVKSWLEFLFKTPFNYYFDLKPTDSFEVTLWILAWATISSVSFGLVCLAAWIW